MWDGGISAPGLWRALVLNAVRLSCVHPLCEQCGRAENTFWEEILAGSSPRRAARFSSADGLSRRPALYVRTHHPAGQGWELGSGRLQHRGKSHWQGWGLSLFLHAQNWAWSCFAAAFTCRLSRSYECRLRLWGSPQLCFRSLWVGGEWLWHAL